MIEKATESEIRRQIDVIKRGSVELIKEDELYEKLSYSISNNMPLKIKAGFDPTSPDIHLGHTVLLNKLRTFQELGHIVYFIIGDFTAMIGDPTGKSETRKPLSKEDVFRNSKDYKNQAFKILNSERTKILFNSWWLSNLKLDEFIKISSNYTVSRMLEKDDFEKRFRDNRPIAMHEFIYPLLQGFDSLFLKADIEIGGNDQKFNLIVGRELMKSSGLIPQVIMTMPLLEGLDGKNKMSKSLGNHIGVSDEPNEMFGKIMSISDEMMLKYYELLSLISNAELNELKIELDKGLNPIIAKKRLATEITLTYHDKINADKASNYFEEKFQKRVNPKDIAIIELKRDFCDKYAETLPDGIKLQVLPLIYAAGAAQTNSEAKRLIKQGAVKIDLIDKRSKSADSGRGKSAGEAIPATGNEIRINSGFVIFPPEADEFVLKVGKKKAFMIKLNLA